MISFAPDPSAIKFIHDRLDVDFSTVDLTEDKYFVIVSHDDIGRVDGAVIAEFKTPFDAHISWAMDNPHVTTMRVWKLFFRTLFTKAVRLTALVKPDNKHCIDMVHRLGFVLEGMGRKMINGRDDALIYGMLKDECRLLYPPDVSRETRPKLRIV